MKVQFFTPDRCLRLDEILPVWIQLLVTYLNVLDVLSFCLNPLHIIVKINEEHFHVKVYLKVEYMKDTVE